MRAKRDTVTYDDVDIFGEDSLNLKMNQEECDFGISHFYVNTYLDQIFY